MCSWVQPYQCFHRAGNQNKCNFLSVYHTGVKRRGVASRLIGQFGRPFRTDAASKGGSISTL